MLRRCLPFALFVLFAATAASASPWFEVGGTAGIHAFDTTNALGVGDRAGATSERNAALFGLRLGVHFIDLVGIEGEVGFIPSESRAQVVNVWNLVWRAHVIFQFGASHPDRRLIPFVLAGDGAESVVHTGNSSVIARASEMAFYGGAGVKYRVDNGWGLRADGRALFPPSSSGGLTVDWEILLSIYKEFGRPPLRTPPGQPAVQ